MLSKAKSWYIDGTFKLVKHPFQQLFTINAFMRTNDKHFPDVRIKGCVFHWTQALWRKIQELGLQHQYQNEQGTYLYLRKFMALLFLPEDEISPMFERLGLQATTAPLKQF